MTSDRNIPPQDIEAEMSILGGIFLENDIINSVHGVMTAADFYRESHRLIFLAMSALSDRNEPIDLITASAELKKSGELMQIGGAAYLAVLVDYVPMSANTLYYCKLVVQKAIERRMLQHAQDAVQIIYSGGDISEALGKLDLAIQAPTGRRSSEPVGMEQSLREACKKLEHRYENQGKVQGLPYGLEELDKKTSGMHPGELIIVAGRPSMGKSAFAGNVLTNVCTDVQKTALFFPLEMSREDITDRLISGQGVKYHQIRNGWIRDWEWSEVLQAAGRLHNMKLLIDDTPAISLKEVRAKARRQKKSGLHLVVIDYLQLMALSNPKDNRVQGLGEITRGLKQLARELEIPVMLLSQLSRAVDTRPDTRPMMSDLRDSGEIEQDADVILFPYRPAAYCKKCRDRVDDDSHNYREHQAEAEIIIEKQRAGERNLSIPVCWRGEYQQFVGI